MRRTNSLKSSYGSRPSATASWRTWTSRSAGTSTGAVRRISAATIVIWRAGAVEDISEEITSTAAWVIIAWVVVAWVISNYPYRPAAIIVTIIKAVPLGICIVAISQLRTIVSIQIKYPWVVVSNNRFWRIDNRWAIRIIIIVPGSVRTPWIAPVIVITVAVVVAWIIKIRIIQIRPHRPVMNFHTQVLVIIIILCLVNLIIVFDCNIFVLLAFRWKINIIGGLAGFISWGAAT